MGNGDEGKSSKSDKPSSPSPSDQIATHVYPDWAAMQAYYGPRVTMPPYYNSAVASGHAPPPYMWGTTHPIMPSYGPPYATIYPHGGVYVHPAVPMGSHGHGVPSSSEAPVETPTKSSRNTNQGLMNKLKGFDGLTMSVKQDQKEAGWGTLTIGGEGNNEARSKPVATREVTATIYPIPVGPVLSPDMTTALELRNPHTMSVKSSPTSVPCVMSPEVWLQNERELKRERRKQSNRESARRSRLRKQAETEELTCKVESLTAENASLRSEINLLTEKSDKLRQENATLVEGLKEEIITNKKQDKDGEMYEKKLNSSAKLHQLLDPSPRADAVAAR
ncbi:putative aldose 1-epimerase [Hibiscus syriacus]|uniref:Aldose 1-epimerase n=1 Tax=Hibiscus syriacus TaxID=106335 RepID=A0A6A3C322_HIBSY|nr:putative aldose 1-epimerase [Hibiscus syriacus]